MIRRGLVCLTLGTSATGLALNGNASRSHGLQGDITYRAGLNWASDAVRKEKDVDGAAFFTYQRRQYPRIARQIANSRGVGTAGLSLGAGAGWTLNTQATLDFGALYHFERKTNHTGNYSGAPYETGQKIKV